MIRHDDDTDAQGSAALRPRSSALGAALRGGAVALLGALLAASAHAVPSYARQTGADCGACHVGAYGPQLTPYGIRFKMGGYVETDGKDGKVPLSGMLVANFTRTSKDAAPADTVERFSSNDNTAMQEASVFLAGRLLDEVGSFVQVTYSGVEKLTSLDQLDLRWARPMTLNGQDAVVGVSLNTNPTLSDPFNSLGQWRFPYTESDFGAGFGPSPLIEGLAGGVVGINPYLFYDKVYAELGLYTGLSESTANNLNVDYVGKLRGPAPYLRLAWFEDHKGYNWMVGLSGLYGALYPDPGNKTAGDTFTDYGIDAQYQFLGTRANIFTVSASYVGERQTLAYTQGVLNEASNRSGTLNQFRLAGSYTWHQTWGGTLGLFDTRGSGDALRYGSSLGGTPNTSGYIAQVDWTPWGKEDSWGAPWANARLGLQYTGYHRFMGGSSYYDGDGNLRQARDNNALMLFIWLAL